MKKIILNLSILLFPLMTVGQIFQYQRADGFTVYSDRVPSYLNNNQIKTMKNEFKESNLLPNADKNLDTNTVKSLRPKYNVIHSKPDSDETVVETH